MTCYKAVFGDQITQNDTNNICDHCFDSGAATTLDAAGTDLTGSPHGSRGLSPATVRRLLGIINLLSVPTCLPLAGGAILVGIGCIALAWRGALPAILPGDE